MIYVDTNVIIDMLERDSRWFDWSLQALAEARLATRVVTGPVVLAELAGHATSADQLGAMVAELRIEYVGLDATGAYRAGQAFRAYRRGGGRRESILADFLIAGQASALSATVLTRDPRRFRSYFPELEVITPEGTHV